MIYRKNLYSWEQMLRLIGGVALVAGGLLGLPGTLWGYALIASGLVAAVTGLFGWCPACAMVGRRIKTDGT
jgi:uncharacterized protein YjeT (DUF2065 family)